MGGSCSTLFTVKCTLFLTYAREYFILDLKLNRHAQDLFKDTFLLVCFHHNPDTPAESTSVILLFPRSSYMTSPHIVLFVVATKTHRRCETFILNWAMQLLYTMWMSPANYTYSQHFVLCGFQCLVVRVPLWSRLPSSPQVATQWRIIGQHRSVDKKTRVTKAI